MVSLNDLAGIYSKEGFVVITSPLLFFFATYTSTIMRTI